MNTLFPSLNVFGYEIISPSTVEYNCIAWAAGEDKRWWWPDSFYQYFWPEGIPREETVDAFVRAFESIGFSVCQDETYEDGFEKIVVYTKLDGKPTHAARQIDSDKWTSKLGRLEDIKHDLNSISGPLYGTPAIFMKRLKNDQIQDNEQ